MENKVLVVGNPVSGNGLGRELLDRIRSPENLAIKALAEKCLAGRPEAWTFVQTTADGLWKEEVEAYIRTRGVRDVIAVGGDGTLMELAALLYNLREYGARLIAVPGGRGNDFVRGYYGYTLEDGEFWSWASRKIQQGFKWSSQPIDLASANGKLFINMASIGYGGRVVENAQNRKAFWSKTPLVYQVEGALALAMPSRGKCDVQVDGVSIYRGPFFGAFVGNGKANGSGLYWTRSARFDDGKLDGIVFPKPSVIEMARVMSAVKAKKAPEKGLPFEYKEFAGSEINFYFEQPTALEVDGDFVGNSMHYGFKCLVKALNTWVIKK